MQVRVDGESVLDTNGAGQVDVLAADGLHFVELHAPVTSVQNRVGLTVDGLALSPWQSYAPMDAAWGLVARLGQPLFNQQTMHLDAMVAMAFFSSPSWDPWCSRTRWCGRGAAGAAQRHIPHGVRG